MKYTTLNYEKLDETIYGYDHPSGLKAILIAKKGYSKKYATFATRYGSIDNEFVIPGETSPTKVPDGVAHFLEHKLFEQKDGNVMDKYAALGAQSNAFTSFGQTVYLFSCTERFEECFRLLLDYVQNPYITEESVEREKGIIGQEIRMYEDDPGWRVYFNLLDAMYVKHPVKLDIAGTIESISHINRDVLYKCFNTFYHPSNMVIIVAGDLEPGAVFGEIEKSIPKGTGKPQIKRIFEKEESRIHKAFTEQKLAVSIPLFYLGFKDVGKYERGNSLISREVAVKIIFGMIFGKSSAFYTKLYEEGLIDGSFEYDYSIDESYAHAIIGGESKYPEKVRDRIVEEVSAYRTKGFDEEEFIRVKNAMKGRYLRALNFVEKTGNSAITAYFKGVNVFDYFEVYDTMKLEDVKRTFDEIFQVDLMSLSVIRPM